MNYEGITVSFDVQTFYCSSATIQSSNDKIDPVYSKEYNIKKRIYFCIIALSF